MESRTSDTGAETPAAAAAELSAAELEAGAALFRLPCDFVKGVVSVAGLPEPRGLEVAFAGRSNVGKSSLLNALVARRALARTSNTPGRTREVNFFALGGEVYLVDLPGYGYARASKSQVAGWNRLIRDYLRGRQSLRRVFLLVDARHGLKASDAPTLALMDEAAVSYQAVLTKTDKLKKADLDKVAAATASALAKHPAAYPEILATSATKGSGIAALRATIATLLAQ